MKLDFFLTSSSFNFFYLSDLVFVLLIKFFKKLSYFLAHFYDQTLKNIF